MRVKIDRDLCPAQLSFCERCFGKFLLHPLGYDRRCFVLLEEDGSDILTIDLYSHGHEQRLELNEEQRSILAREGWAKFVDFAVPNYKVPSAH